MDDPYDIPLMDAHLNRGKVSVQQRCRQRQRVAGLNGPPRCTNEHL